MKSLSLLTVLVGVTNADVDASGLLQVGRSKKIKAHNPKHPSLAHNEIDCTKQPIYFWLGGHRDVVETVSAADGASPALLLDGDPPQWEVRDTYTFSQDAALVAYARTGGKTCNQWCQERSLSCVRGMDDAHHQIDQQIDRNCDKKIEDCPIVESLVGHRCTLFPEGHSRTDMSGGGCNQKWQTQMCACTDPTQTHTLPMRPSLVLPPVDPGAITGALLVAPAASQCFADGIDPVPVNFVVKTAPGSEYEAANLANNKRYGKNDEFQQLNIKANTQATFRLVLQPDGDFVLTPSPTDQFEVKIWDMDAGSMGRTGNKPKGPTAVEYISVNTDGLAAHSHGALVEEVTGTIGDKWDTPPNTRTFRATSQGFGWDNVLTVGESLASDNADYMTSLPPHVGLRVGKNIPDSALATAAKLQQDRALSLTFRGKSEIEFTFSVPGGKSGRNVIFTVAASPTLHCDPKPPVVTPPVVTPPVVTAPVVTPPLSNEVAPPSTTTTTTTTMPDLTPPTATPCNARFDSGRADHKCPYKNEDRLWRIDGTTFDTCALKCMAHSECSAFSWAEKGQYARLCMGCKGAEPEQEHTGFTYHRVECGLQGVSEGQQCRKHVGHSCHQAAILETSIVSDYSECVVACGEEEDCELFHFDTDTGDCDLCKDHANFIGGAGAASAVYGSECDEQDFTH